VSSSWLRALAVPWAGLVAGPTAWAINTQLGYSLVPWICASKVNLIPPLALGFALTAAFAGVLSWSSLEGSEPDSVGRHEGGRPQRLLAGVGVLAAMLFAAVILTQGAAGLVLDGCER
jgi:hypothetical protein